MLRHPRPIALLVVLLATLAVAVDIGSSHAAANPVAVHSGVLQVFQTLVNDPRVQDALAFIEADHARRVEETLELVRIPAPPFNEHLRAEAFCGHRRESGHISGRSLGHRKSGRCERPPAHPGGKLESRGRLAGRTKRFPSPRSGSLGLTDPLLPEHLGYDYRFDGLREIPEAYRAPGHEYRFSWTP